MSTQARKLDLGIDLDELDIHFAPIVSLKTGAIVALEAHARLRRISEGLLTAGEIRELARDSGQIVEADRHVVELATDAMMRLTRNLVPIYPVAVNLSSEILESPADLEGMMEDIRASGLPEEMFRLEVLAGDVSGSAIRKRLEDVAAAGVRIMLDRVTTIEEVNLAESMGAGVKLSEALFFDDNPSRDAEIRSLLASARKGHLGTAAAGIRTLRQLDFLALAGCAEAQGAIISRPRPMEELLFLLRRGRCW